MITKRLVVLLSLAAVLFAVNIWGYDLWPADEPRYGEVAREMIASGDYLVPRVNGEPYYEKPPLLFWMIALVSAPFGEVTAATARIPSVLSGVAVVCFTYSLATRLFSARVAFWAAIILMTSVRFWWQARTAQIDMLLTACMTAGLYCLWRWEEERASKWVWGLWAAVALGMYAKGPPALVFPLAFTFTFYWKAKTSRQGIHWVLGIVSVLCAFALWYVPAHMAAAESAQEAVASGMAENVFRNTIGRLFLGVSKAQAPWYYATTLPVDMMPWTLFAPWAVLWAWKNRRTDTKVRFLLHWIVPALIVFSISIGKRAIYILPLFPAIAILMAAALVALAESDRVKWRRRTGFAWAVVLVIVGAVPFAIPLTPYAKDFTFGVGFTGAVSLLFAVSVARYCLSSDVRMLHGFVASHFAVLLFLSALFALPILNGYKSARNFCEPVRRLAEKGEEFRLYSVGFSREEYIFYSKHFHEAMFTELIDAGGTDLAVEARRQKRVRRTMERQVEEVEIEDIENVTRAERMALAEALETAITTMEGEADWSRTFEKRLRRDVKHFSDTFSQGPPAFMFVEDTDWRWLLAIEEELGTLNIVGHEHVGSREMLLLSNEIGAKSLDAAGEGRWTKTQKS